MGWSPGEVVRKKVDEALRRLSADLAAGKSEGLTAYLTAMSRFRHYAWDNILLINAQRPEATRLAGHHGWHDLGRAVKRGEKGILIFASPDRDPFRRTDARTTYMFDVSQTDGKPLPEPEFVDHPQLGREQFEVVLARHKIGDQSVAKGAAYVAARALGIDGHTADVALFAANGADQAGVAQRLAAIRETSTQILDELLSKERVKNDGSPLPRLDAENFKHLHLEFGERLVNSLTRIVRDRDQAEEIAARAFEIAWAKRDSFRGNAALSTWIEAIGRNEARHFYQRYDRQFDSLDREDAIDVAVADRVMDDLEKREDRDRLKMALSQLPDRLQKVLTSHFQEGLSIREIAQREKMPLGTVLSRIHSGKQMLRETLEAQSTPLNANLSDPTWER